VQEASRNDPDIHVLLLPPSATWRSTALVRGSTVVLQKSVRERVRLTVRRGFMEEEAGDRGAGGRHQTTGDRTG